MDGGAWKAAVHGVAEGRTRQSNFTFTFHFYALEKAMATHSSVLAWRIPGTGEPGGLPSMGSHRVGHDWSDLAALVKHRLLVKHRYPLKPHVCNMYDSKNKKLSVASLHWSDLAVVLLCAVQQQESAIHTHTHRLRPWGNQNTCGTHFIVISTLLQWSGNKTLISAGMPII